MRLAGLSIRKCAAVVLAFLAFIVPLQANAQSQAPEPDLKAAIISNMLLFVEWPVQASISSNQLVICYVDISPVATALINLDGKSIKGKTLKVTQLDSGKTGKCNALYLSPGNAATLGETLAVLGSSSIFLAGDSPEYSQRGVMLNLELVSGRVVFDIDLRSVQKAGLQVSSKALRLARRVIE